MSNWRVPISLMAAVAFAGFVAAIAIHAAEDPSAQTPPDAAEVAALVKQLDSDSFAERQAASDRLTGIGRPAVSALAKAAVGDSLEVTVRSIDVLRNLLKSNDEPTRDTAKAALEELAGGTRAAVAVRAARALKPADEQLPPARQILPAVPGAAIQIAVGGAARVNVRVADGVRTVEAEEDGRKVRIVDDPAQGIKMTVTSKKDGKEVIETYEAKNAGELKKQHPEAHEIYEKYSRMGGGGAIAVQMQIGGNVQPIPVPIQPPNHVGTAAQVLPGWGATLARMATEEAIRRASKESNEQLKEKVGEFREQLEQLEKRLQEAIEKADEER